MQGWIKLHRQIRGHAFYKQKRTFSRFEAWVDMLLDANHCDNPWIAGNEIITVERGTYITSELKLMDRWKWSKSKVRAFLKLLEDEKMIIKKADNKKTAITIVNYDIYQEIETAKEPQKDFKKTSKRLQKDTNKNYKNYKNEKNEKNVKKVQYREFVNMLPEEFEKLKEQYGEIVANQLIEILDNYKGATGKTYKSDYRAILSWVIKRYEEDKKKPSGKTEEPQAWETIREWGKKKEAQQRHDANS